MQWLLSGLLSVALLAAVPFPAVAEDGLRCEMPADLTTPSDPLTHVAGALKATNHLEILALGSGSTVGDTSAAAGAALSYRAPQASFPYRMVENLRAIRPAGQFQLTVRGGREMTAEMMVPILQQELAAHHYDLVLWQTGTVEAVRGLSPDGLHDILQEGADAAAKADVDLVLIDPQFSRFLRANADVSPYETVLQKMAGNPDVTLFHRFDLTQLWVGNGEIDLERATREHRDETVALLNRCLGEALARYVLAGAGGY